MAEGTANTGSAVMSPVTESARSEGGNAQAAEVVSQRPDASEALRRGVHCLLREQAVQGYWCGELEGDSILQSEYLLMKWMLGQERGVAAEHASTCVSGGNVGREMRDKAPMPSPQPSPGGRGGFDPRLVKIANYLRRQQQDDGAWVQYPGADMDLSATVKGYFALKLMGDSPDAPHMRKARERVLAAGGAELANSFSKFYLAGLGQVSYDALPSIPPEIVFLPKAFYFHMDKISAWSRTMIAPLSIVTSHRPVRKLPESLGIAELFVDSRKRYKLVATQVEPHPFWSRFFLGVDKGLKLMDKLGPTPPRRVALKRLETWLLEHMEGSEGLGAIFPPMVYIQVALQCLGYPDDHPVLVKARKDLDDLMIFDEEREEIRIQPCFSPVWDTGIAAYALAEAGLGASDEPMRRCAQWLVSKECRRPVDWASNISKRKQIEPSGWFFEYENPFYPDVDDTAMVSMSLKRIASGTTGASGTAGGLPASADSSVHNPPISPDIDQWHAAAQRGAAWILAMQNSDGGWAAFDRTRSRPILEHVPFADHNAIQDPSCPDITGRVLECLGNHDYRADHPAVSRAIDFIHSRQARDGAWFGRWGVNYIYGTFQVLVGLEQVGCDMKQEWVRRAGDWLKAHQQANGSFGESANSYVEPALRGKGPSTASQTAWGAMGMMAVFGADDPAVRRAISWLCKAQLNSGTWNEEWFTGTGFPRVFYLRYHLYRLYFPVMAIARYLRRHDALPPFKA